MKYTWKLTLSDGSFRLHIAKDIEAALRMYDERNNAEVVKIERLD